MKVKYDFHIHSALSPCALDEMTPNNIVNMSYLSDLQAIAVTDHNSGGNVEAVIQVAKGIGLIALAGMEVETKEEIHMVCLFADIENLSHMQTLIYDNLPMLKNKPGILGKQLLYDQNDDIIREEERLLSFATTLSFEEIIEKTWECGGIAIPAHIDRPSYSVISNLGILPEHKYLKCLEISQYANFQEYQNQYPNYIMLQSSDSHELGFIGVCNGTIEIPDVDEETLTASVIIDHLRNHTV